MEEMSRLDSFSLDPAVKKKLLVYIDIINDYKDKINLVGKKKTEDIIENLLIPSIICTRLVDRKMVIDIGSGSGIVGIPIKLINNSVKLIICEKNLKKIAFLNHVVLKLDIKDISIISKSLENVDKNDLQNVDQLLIRGIKLVDIYDTLMEKFPRGTSLIYFGSEGDVGRVSADIEDRIPLAGNDSRRKGLHIFSLKLN